MNKKVHGAQPLSLLCHPERSVGICIPDPRMGQGPGQGACPYRWYKTTGSTRRTP